jgi:hypothetical protein
MTHDSDHSDEDLQTRLRAADPAARLPTADPAEVDRLLQRVVDTDLRETGTRRRSPLTWLVAAAAVVVIAAGAFLWWGRSGDEGGAGLVADPTVDTSPPSASTTQLSVGAAGGRCMVPTAEMLAGQQVAFSGTVVGVTEGVVTIRTTSVFAGDVSDEVTVTGAVAPDTGGVPEGDPEFVAGQDYLVAASDGRVLGCGLSGPATAGLQALYAEAFPR